MNIFFKDDPVFSVLHDVFQANILKIPDERIVPLGVIEDPFVGKAKFRTTLDLILKQPDDLVLNNNYLEQKRMASLSGTKTNETDLKIGLEILSNFLNAFGVNLPNLAIYFKNADKVSFSFENVFRTWLDNGFLASILDGNQIVKNALTNSFFGFPGAKLLVIDSIITSNDFSIYVAEEEQDQFKFDVAAIQKELGSITNQVQVKSSNRQSLTFKGEKNLPFAFTCLQLELDRKGRITKMPAFTKDIPIVMKGKEKEKMEKYLLAELPTFVELEFE